MYEHIMVPVDLEHTEALAKALSTAALVAAQTGATVTFVGVTTSAPSSVAHNPEEFGEKLEAFARSEAGARDIEATSLARVSHDPTRDLNKTLIEAAEEIDADLIVMASHVPGFAEHIFASHAGYVASHAKISVLVVR